jgi:hypothetical protein
MKTAKEWVNENSQSGPFDTVGDCEEAESLVKAIQKDAIKHCWNQINARIERGKMDGNGCDASAQRNGLILAANIVMELQAPNDESSDTREGAK